MKNLATVLEMIENAKVAKHRNAPYFVSLQIGRSSEKGYSYESVKGKKAEVKKAVKDYFKKNVFRYIS